MSAPTHPTPTPTPEWGAQPPTPNPKPRRRIVITVASIVGGALLLGLAYSAGTTDGQGDAKASQPSVTAPTTPANPGDPTAPLPDDSPGVEDEPAPPVTHKVGETAFLREEGLTSNTDVAEITVDKAVASKSAYGIGETEYPDNKYFVKFKVTVKAYDDGFEVNPYDFFIRNADGSRLDSGEGNTIFVQAKPDFSSATLKGGESYTGWIVFDLPAKHGELVYSGPGWGDESISEWSF
jgi:hypothetical protein